jgi:protocatechuate 3,4-dioxygenase beta subunit
MSAPALLIALTLVAFVPAGPTESRQQRDHPAPAIGTGSISGRAYIVENAERVPLRRARVRLDDVDGATAVTTDTDVNGFYRFDHLPAGSFRVTVEKAGFVPHRAPFRQFAPSHPVELGAAASVRTNVEMVRASAIEGRVLDNDGQPITDVIVTATRWLYTKDDRRLVPVRQAHTDSRGRFRIHTLPAGEYRIEAAPDQRARLSAQRAPDAPARGLARIYYPGTPWSSEAFAVVTVAGQDVEGIDFVTTEVPVARVSGTVTTASGTRPAGLSVRVRSTADVSEGAMGLLSRSGDGFEFRDVPPGEYWLLAVAVATPGAVPEYVATRMNVDGRDVMGLTLTTAPGTPVSGLVRSDTGEPLPARMEVAAVETALEMPVTGTLPPAVAALSRSRVAADGRFSFRSLFGPRRFRVDNLPAGWALAAVRKGDRDITDEWFDLSGGQPMAPIDVVITSRTATVTGRVHLDAGRAAGRARVVVFNEDRERWGPASRFVSTVETSADGSFEVRGVLPGVYRITAVDYLDEGAWMDPDVLGRLWSAATPAALGAGQRHEVLLQVR